MSTRAGSVIIAHIPYELRGGEDTHVELLAEAYAKIGKTPHFYPANRNPPRQRLAGALRSLWPTGNFSDLDELLRRTSASLVHVHNPYPTLGPRFFGQLAAARVPVLMTVHNHRFYCTNGLALRDGKICKDCRPVNAPWKPLVRDCNGDLKKSAYYALAIAESRALGLMTKAVRTFVAPSPYIRDELVAFGVPSDRVRLIVNPVYDPSKSPELSALNEPRCDVFYAGRLSAEKGIKTLLETVEKMPRLTFAIAGEGPLADDVKRAADKLGNLRVLGPMPRDEVLRRLRACRTAVSPSICNEILPTFALEAFCESRRAVVPDLDSTRWLAQEPFFGVTSRPGDSDDLARAISHALALPEVSEDQAAEVRRELGFERFCDELAALTDGFYS